MALLTLGTAATTTLSAIQFVSPMNQTDFAALAAKIKAQNPFARVTPQDFDQEGFLYLSGGRGKIRLQPGDFVAVDPASGWPIVVTPQAITGGGFVHS